MGGISQGPQKAGKVSILQNDLELVSLGVSEIIKKLQLVHTIACIEVSHHA